MDNARHQGGGYGRWTCGTIVAARKSDLSKCVEDFVVLKDANEIFFIQACQRYKSGAGHAAGRCGACGRTSADIGTGTGANTNTGEIQRCATSIVNTGLGSR